MVSEPKAFSGKIGVPVKPIYDAFGNLSLTKRIEAIQDQKHPVVSEISENKFIVAWVDDNTNINYI